MRNRFVIQFATSVVVSLGLMAAMLIALSSAHVAAEPAPPLSATAGSASLHNPGFDNHDWYEFNLRYQGAYPRGAWLPDDDNNVNNNIPDSIRQDWRLWFLDGTEIVEPDPEKTYVLNDEAVQMRTYTNEKKFLAGIYQPIYNVTPCLIYGFQMYAQSRPEGSDDSLVALQVGIDRVGWHPNSATDPAVHGSFPHATVWGPSQKYQWAYGPLTVTAEAWNTKITVFTYADATGGRSHRILWDSGSFWDATPPMIHDPNNLPSPTGISNLNVITTGTTVTITWTTEGDALGQVYYRLVSAPSGPPPPGYPYKVYLPIVMKLTGWQYTPLNKTPTTNHQAVLTNLPGGTYEFIAVSRGLSCVQCVTWRSKEGQFTIAP